MVAQVSNKAIKVGQKITLTYEDREFEVIVIDPHGLGRNQPLIGFGFRMAERHIGIKHNTLSGWLTKESVFEGGRNNEVYSLKLPSGKRLRVVEISALDGNEYITIEASDWVELAGDVIETPGKLSKPVKKKVIDFLKWFAVKGLYAEAYAALKGQYTQADSINLSNWLNSRLGGIPVRNKYTNFLTQQGCYKWHEYANWTNYIYRGLFGMTAKQMNERWGVVDGDKSVARNRISEANGLEAIAFCEKQVVELFVDDLKEAHDLAISIAKRKFLRG